MLHRDGRLMMEMYRAAMPIIYLRKKTPLPASSYCSVLIMTVIIDLVLIKEFWLKCHLLLLFMLQTSELFQFALDLNVSLFPNSSNTPGGNIYYVR